MGKYFVSGSGLDQRTVYSISTIEPGVGYAESLKLSMLCMKTGFEQYHTEEDTITPREDEDCTSTEEAFGPRRCATSSYIYQYATLRFTPGPLVGDCERTECFVVDALDEVHIEK